MSDLQCAATVLVLRADAAAVASVAGDRVALVYDGVARDAGASEGRGTGEGPDDPVEVLARALGVGVRALDAPVSRREVERREPEALRALQDLADLHRGETVVLAVAEPGPVVDVRIDGDGVVVQRR